MSKLGFWVYERAAWAGLHAGSLPTLGHTIKLSRHLKNCPFKSQITLLLRKAFPDISTWWIPPGQFYSSLKVLFKAAAAAAKSLQSCPTLCDPIDGSPPSSPIPGILQARTLEWVAISFSNAWKWKVIVKSLSHARLLVTPWTAAYQPPPSMGFSRQEYWSGVPLRHDLVCIFVFMLTDCSTWMKTPLDQGLCPSSSLVFL